MYLFSIHSLGVGINAFHLFFKSHYVLTTLCEAGYFSGLHLADEKIPRLREMKSLAGYHTFTSGRIEPQTHICVILKCVLLLNIV